MHITAAVMLVLSVVPATLAKAEHPRKDRDSHTLCYNLFMDNDKCVHSSPIKEDRCPFNKTHKPHEVPNDHGNLLATPPNTVTGSRLVRRYDSVNTSYAIGGGSGICGPYDTHKPGVCLTVGTEHVYGNDTKTAGWLNGVRAENCGKEIYIKRKSKTDEDHTVYAPVVDGCSFNEFNMSIGCFRIAFTQATFNALKPSAQELKDNAIKDLLWDFNNLDGLKPQNGPI